MAKKVCPKCKGKGCSHCGGTGYHKVGMAKGGDMGKKMNAGMAALKKEAPEVAKKMGYMYGGVAKKPNMKSMGMMSGGMAKKKMGYAHGGLACGASNKPSQAGTRSIKTS
jgi:hypothetical protein